MSISSANGQLNTANNSMGVNEFSDEGEKRPFFFHIQQFLTLILACVIIIAAPATWLERFLLPVVRK